MLLVSRGRGVIFKSFIIKHPDLLRGSDFGSDIALYLLIYHQHISPKTIASGFPLKLAAIAIDIAQKNA